VRFRRQHNCHDHKETRGMLVRTQVCIECGQSGEVEIPTEAIDRYKIWMSGVGNIQKMLPELSDDEREQLMTGTHGSCYDLMAPDE
jgi:transcription elongation factor Elf1